MAKQNGILKIEGTLENLTFYKGADGYRVRTKGGVSRNRILNDPTFVRTRENVSEFGECATAGKVLRLATGGLVSKAKDGKLASRLTGVLAKVKNNDLVSARGQRKVGVGIETEEGKLVLKGFDFNVKAPMENVLKTAFVFDAATGSLDFTDFNAAEHLKGPNGATHFSMQNAVLDLNFATKVSNLSVSEVLNSKLASDVVSFTLAPPEIPPRDGTQFHLLLIEFFQSVNGVQYSLKNGSHNVLHIIEVV